MLTSMHIQAQNISAVENGRHGLGGSAITGALRHLSGGIFVRACIAFTSERCGTLFSVSRPVSRSANPQRLAHHLGGWYRDFGKNQHRSLVMQEKSSIGTSVPVLSVVKNQVTALSTDVAEFFEKRHDAVLRDIKKLITSLPLQRLHNFVETEILRASPLIKGAEIKSKAYRMTRDGFTLLVMGWTGEKALQFKLAWLDAFNKMEEELRAKNTVQALPSSSPLGKSVAPAIAAAPMLQGQLQCIQLAMRDRFPYQHDLLRAYSIMQHHFCVTSYRQIPAARFDEVMGYIKTLVLNPVRAKRPKALPAPQSS